MSLVTVRSQCPDCGTKIRVQAEANTEVQARCPKCGVRLRFPAGASSSPLPSGRDSSLDLGDAGPGRPLPAGMPPIPAIPPHLQTGSGSMPVIPAIVSGSSHRQAVVGSAIGGGLALVLVIGGWLWLERGDTRPAKAINTAGLNSPQSPEIVPQPGADPTKRPANPPAMPPVVPPKTPQNPEDARRGFGPPKSKDALPALGERYALLIGVQNYNENVTGLKSLRFTENDVHELQTVLVKECGFREHNVVVMTQKMAAQDERYLPDRTRIFAELEALLEKRTSEDVVIVAFAGHGVSFKGEKESYFCPLGTRLDKRETLVSFSDVYDALGKTRAGFRLLLTDACRNEAIGGGARRATVDVDSVTRPPEPSRNGGLAAFFSCAPGEFAYEDADLQHGVFFDHVIRGLRGEADLTSDHEVTLFELATYASKHVPDYVKRKFDSDQTPSLTGDVQGEVVLARVTATPKPQQIPPPDPPGGTKPTTPGDPGRELTMEEKNRVPPGNYPPEVIVPNVTGATVARARELLHEVGLGLELSSEAAKDTDIVNSQGTVAGKPVPSLTAVKLGRLKAPVPKVIGMKCAEATKLLEAEGFKIETALAPDSELPITHQNPAADRLHMRGDKVDFNHMFSIPDMTGLDLQTAKRRFDDLGVPVKIEAQSVSGDKVYTQFPRGNQLIAHGVPVRLTPGVPAPNLIGSYSSAQQKLRQVGLPGKEFSRRTIRTNSPSLAAEASVEWQSVTPGTIIPRHQTISVKLVVYQYVP